MSELMIEISQEADQKMRELAQRLGTTAEALASASLADMVCDSQHEVEEAISRTVQKNHELYKRLS